MPQDSPATDAGTESASPIDQLVDLCVEHRLALPHDGILQLARRIKRDRVPDNWAPVNRREMRDDVDRFRNERMQVPRDMSDARQIAAFALEYYEHAHEVTTRTAITLDEIETELSAFLNNTTPEYRAIADHRARIRVKSYEADKELDVAERRLRVAVGYMNTFKGE